MNRALYFEAVPAKLKEPKVAYCVVVRTLFGAALIAACHHPSPDNAAPDASSDSPAGRAQAVAEARDAAVAALMDGGTYAGPMLGALYMAAPVMSDMEFPLRDGARGSEPREKVVRLGYIRQGQKVPVIPEAHPKPNCQEGWYELLAGGFVCGKFATLDLNHPKIRLASHTPFTEGPLPYEYGYNVRNGTPLYRSVPSRQERVRFEPWLVARPRPRPSDDENAYADNGGGGASANAADPFSVFGGDLLDAGTTPWYLRDYDGGKPQVTLDDLRGEGGPMERRMVKGFYLALDKSFKAGASKWWRTTGNLIAPFERIMVQPPKTDFHGVWLNTSPAAPPSEVSDRGPPASTESPVPWIPARPITKLPVGFILWRGHKYTLSDDHKKMVAGETIPRFTVLALTGKRIVVSSTAFEETDDGTWMRASEGRITKPGPPPRDLTPGEKWIDVNLETQTLVAFEGDKPVYATLVSSGKHDDNDEEKDHRTVTGSFRIREKHIAATMDGDVASDGPYSIEDVPWIMYFKGSYALHGAFWHNLFGNEKSHGCVNLAPYDAKALFGWTEPRMPPGWHGVQATDERPGTRVVVHDESESSKRWRAAHNLP